MKATFAKIVGPTICLLVFGSVSILGVRAQQSTGSTTTVRTNWIGGLVAGRNDTFDRISKGPYPTIVRQVEIGLRSDGVVVWREVPAAY